MKIITWNVNGIRAVERKGEIQNLITNYSPDVFMVQETKGNADQFSEYLTGHVDYHQYYHSAQKKGYAGTSIWIKKTVSTILEQSEFRTEVPKAPNADEGRISHFHFEFKGQPWDLLSIYFPNGGKSEQAWVEKLEFYDRVHDYMNLLREQGSIVLVGGDMNVAHTEIDIARPKQNDGKIGFHPDERAWMDRLVADGWVDVWRARNPGVTDVYSWWHMISRGRERNVGWRIDYFLMDQIHLARVGDVEYLNDQMGSDHCPLSLTLSL
jgi:exodeoxyribonuclease-3